MTNTNLISFLQQQIIFLKTEHRNMTTPALPQPCTSSPHPHLTEQILKGIFVGCQNACEKLNKELPAKSNQPGVLYFQKGQKWKQPHSVGVIELLSRFFVKCVTSKCKCEHSLSNESWQIRLIFLKSNFLVSPRKHSLNSDLKTIGILIKPTENLTENFRNFLL